MAYNTFALLSVLIPNCKAEFPTVYIPRPTSTELPTTPAVGVPNVKVARVNNENLSVLISSNGTNRSTC